MNISIDVKNKMHYTYKHSLFILKVTHNFMTAIYVVSKKYRKISFKCAEKSTAISQNPHAFSEYIKYNIL